MRNNKLLLYSFHSWRGIRGLLSCKLLERIERFCPGYLDGVDLIAGISTGGILALGPAAGLTPTEMTDVYQRDGGKVFYQTISDKYRFLEALERLRHADYGNSPLVKALRERFGDLRLGYLKKKVLISSFRLDSGSITKLGVRSWKQKFSKTLKVNLLIAIKKLWTSPCGLVQLLLFPLYQGFADGGLVANNSTMCALAQALDKVTGRQRLSKITLLSIGTGVRPKWIEGLNEDWRYLQWRPHLIGIMMDAASGVGLRPRRDMTEGLANFTFNSTSASAGIVRPLPDVRIGFLHTPPNPQWCEPV